MVAIVRLMLLVLVCFLVGTAFGRMTPEGILLIMTGLLEPFAVAALIDAP